MGVLRRFKEFLFGLVWDIPQFFINLVFRLRASLSLLVVVVVVVVCVFVCVWGGWRGRLPCGAPSGCLERAFNCLGR